MSTNTVVQVSLSPEDLASFFIGEAKRMPTFMLSGCWTFPFGKCLQQTLVLSLMSSTKSKHLIQSAF